MPLRSRIFLLSPAHAGGERAKLLLRPTAQFDLAQRLRSAAGATLGEVYSFTSGLYFRGKLAYARTFGRARDGSPSSLVIVPGYGLIEPDRKVTSLNLAAFSRVSIDLRNRKYRQGLGRAAAALRKELNTEDEIVLLGSIASGKYTDVLLEVFGAQLFFPTDFVGRGDMSRGGLLLRCAEAKTELAYQRLMNAVVHGPRPSRLPPRSKVTLPLPVSGS